MSYSLETRIEIGGDRTLFERASNSFRNPRVLMKRIGVLGMSSGLRRLTQVLKQEDDGVRSGRLTGSLTVSNDGVGHEGTIFDLGKDFVAVGSNLPYAAQVQFGGTILPRDAKALAIPLPVKLKRSRQSPRDIDPGKTVLRFQPLLRPKPNVVGLLIDPEGKLGYGKGPLYVLAYWVTQQARPFLYWDSEDMRVIGEDIYPEWLNVQT